MISISTGSIYHLGLERAFEIIQKAGFEYVELLLRSLDTEGYYDTWDLDYLKKLKKRYGLKISTIHIDFMFEEKPRSLVRVNRLLNNLNAKYIIIHLPRYGEKEYIGWFRKNVSKLQKSQTILVENMGDKTIWKSARKLKTFNGINFDISHSMRAIGEDTRKITNELKNIKQFHISGFDGEHCHKSIFESEKQIHETLSNNREAIFCLEVAPRAFKNKENLEDVVKEIETMREFLEKIKNEQY